MKTGGAHGPSPRRSASRWPAAKEERWAANQKRAAPSASASATRGSAVRVAEPAPLELALTAAPYIERDESYQVDGSGEVERAGVRAGGLHDEAGGGHADDSRQRGESVGDAHQDTRVARCDVEVVDAPSAKPECGRAERYRR